MHFLQPVLNPAEAAAAHHAYGPLSVPEILPFLLDPAAAQRSHAENSADDSAIEKYFLAIPGKAGTRWIVPTPSRDCGQIFSSWRPYDLRSRLKWSVVELASWTGLLGHLPGVRRAHFPSALFLRRLEQFGLGPGLTPVVQVGNPSSTRKLIVFLLRGSAVQAILKIPLTQEARVSVANEAAALEQIRAHQARQQQEPPFQTPQKIFHDNASGWLAQTWVDGAPSPRTFAVEHAECLLRLVLPEKTASLTQAIDRLTAKHADISRGGVDPAVREGLMRAADSSQLPQTCVHGDFVPWNIKIEHRQLRIFDWESARFDGAPLQDICHFFYKQDYLFHDVGDLPATLLDHPHVAHYSRALSLSPSICLRLALYYLLEMYCFHFQHGEDALYGYDLVQMRRVLAALQNLES
jgi:hypothetical protein